METVSTNLIPTGNRSLTWCFPFRRRVRKLQQAIGADGGHRRDEDVHPAQQRVLRNAIFGAVGCPDHRIDRSALRAVRPFQPFHHAPLARSRLSSLRQSGQCNGFPVAFAFCHHRPGHARYQVKKAATKKATRAAGPAGRKAGAKKGQNPGIREIGCEISPGRSVRPGRGPAIDRTLPKRSCRQRPVCPTLRSGQSRRWRPGSDFDPGIAMRGRPGQANTVARSRAKLEIENFA